MNSTHFTTVLRRFGQAMSVALVAAGFAAISPAAHAQAGNLSLNGGTASNCATFTGFSWSGGTLTVNCTAVVQTCDTNAATTGFHVNGSSMNAAVNTTQTITVVRDGGCQGSYTVGFGSGGFPDPNQANSQPTGWSVSPQNSITFAQGETSKTIQVNTGSTPGLIGVWMTGATPTTASASGGMAIYVQPAQQQNQQNGTCGSANYIFNAANNNQVIFGSNETASNPGLMPGQTVALAFTFNPPYSGGGAMQLSPVTNGAYGQGAVDTEISIDRCAGVFQSNPTNSASQSVTGAVVSADNCDIRVPASAFAGQGITAIVASITGASNSCKLTAGNSYYINIRHMPANFSNNTSSCTDNQHGCTLRVQPMGLMP